MLDQLKASIKKVPVLGPLFVKLKRRVFYKGDFNHSVDYWETRYATGGNSGSGSYNHLAKFKADVINEFLTEQQINSALEFGCGDGNQLGMITYKNYIGFDVSKSAIKLCAEKYQSDPSKSFFLYDSETFYDNHKIFQVDLSLSLDVIYHIVEDPIYEKYLHHLFSTSTRFVIIYSSNFNSPQYIHVKHREFSKLVEKRYPEWELLKKIQNPFTYTEKDEDNTSSADFYIYKRKGS